MWIYLWLFLSSPQLKALVSFSDQNFSVVHHRRRCHRCCCHKVFSSSPLPCGQFQPNKSIFNEGYASFLNEGPLLFRRWDNYEIEKIHRQNSKIIICRTSGQISTKLSTNHPWLKGSTLFQMEIITKFQKYIFKSVFFLDPIWGRNSASVAIRISSKFSQIAWKISKSKNSLKKNCKIFFYVMLSCILFLQLTELAFIYCYNYLNTLNTLPI